MGSMAPASPAEPSGQLLEHYYSIQKSLASDTTSGVSAAAAAMVKISRQSAGTETKAKAQLAAVADAASKLQTHDLTAARNGFGELSDRLIEYLKANPVKSNPPYQYYCSMVKKSWLQREKGAHNPYYGSEMPTCGELVQAAQSPNPPAGHTHH